MSQEIKVGNVYIHEEVYYSYRKSNSLSEKIEPRSYIVLETNVITSHDKKRYVRLYSSKAGSILKLSEERILSDYICISDIKQ